MIPTLTLARIKTLATTASFRRGCEYADAGAVVSAVFRDGILRAEVEGSEFQPYRVRVRLDDGGPSGATCSCPYDADGWCKHLVAVLVTCVRNADAVEERRSVEEVLQGMSRDELAAVVRWLVARDPRWIDWIDGAADDSIDDHAPATPNGRRTPVDVKAIRSRVRGVFDGILGMYPSYAYGHASANLDEISDEIRGAQRFTEASDGHAALQCLEAIATEYVELWHSVQEPDYQGFLFEDLDAAFAEAFLTAELTSEDRDAWSGRLRAWQDEAAEYGLDDAFADAVSAADAGWDDDYLQAILDGRDLGPTDESTGLSLARLNVLDRQGRTDAYLRLADSAGLTKQYLLMLIRLGRCEEAVAEGLDQTLRPDDALAVARALAERGAPESALRVAVHGLALDQYGRGPLAEWVIDLATSLQLPDVARDAALVAFLDRPGLAAYLQIERLTGDDWPKYRGKLLEKLRSSNSVGDRVDVLIHEGLIEEAIVLADQHSHAWPLVRQVVEAAVEKYPEWVIRAASSQAAMIVSAKRSRIYHHAVDWLKHVREAHRTMDRDAEWDVWLKSFAAEHRRKYRLMELMREEGLVEKSAVARYRFRVRDDAPVGQPFVLRFEASSSGNQLWTKAIRLEVAPPEQITLRGNYPNPFNPTTTIGYDLPESSHVRLVVFDVLGRELARLVDEVKAAGHHVVRWNAAGSGSGTYLYTLEVVGESGGRTMRRGRMVMVR